MGVLPGCTRHLNYLRGRPVVARAACGAHIARGWVGWELEVINVGCEQRWNVGRKVRVGH